MFSGIVEEMATLVAIDRDQDNIDFTFKCSFVDHLKIDQSISHNGVCLTVVRLTDDTYTVTIRYGFCHRRGAYVQRETAGIV